MDEKGSLLQILPISSALTLASTICMYGHVVQKKLIPPCTCPVAPNHATSVMVNERRTTI